jgi:transcriptional regulator with XRE-family HTH domain
MLIENEQLRHAVGRFLRRKRKEKGFSARQLSMLIQGNEYFNSNIINIENGKVSTDINTLEKILLNLDTNLVDFFNNI